MTRKNLFTAVFTLLFSALALLAGFAAPMAARAAAEEGIGFYVRALLPDNQTDNTLSYFSLRVAPGQSQLLEVEVVNQLNEAITVDIAAISASTNRNGVIDYKTPGIRDKSMFLPFSSVASLESSVLSIPANSTATARVTLHMPAEQYNGVVLGGLVFTRRPAVPDADGELSLQNVYSYVLGVKLSETDVPVSPDFELDSIHAQTVNFLPAMVHSIRNKNAAIAKNIRLSVAVRDAAGNIVAEISRGGVDMAPNSLMPLAVTPLAADGGPAGLVPGSYTSEITLEHDGQSWQFEEKFTIGSVEADDINAQAVGTIQIGRGGIPLNQILTIGLAMAALVILLLFILLLLALRRRDKQQ